jgi:hypothetical protein
LSAKKGCVAKILTRQKSLWESSDLPNNSEDFVKERDLSYDIAFLDTLNLSFTDHIHCLNASDGASSGIEGLKAHPRFSESLDEAMILLDDIIQILELS